MEVGHFLLDGELTGTALHAHARAEIHLITRGEADYTVDTQIYRLRAGDMLYIPKKVLHASVPRQPETQFYVITAIADISEPRLVHLSQTVLALLEEAGREAEAAADPERMAPWFLYILGLLHPKGFTRVEESSDDIATLMKFISVNYHRDITLADAAGAANLSQRQAQRLIKRETSRTFLQELTLQRMTVAAHLVAHTRMSMEEIARYVGYQSYSGFWKAWRRFKNEAGAKE